MSRTSVQVLLVLLKFRVRDDGSGSSAEFLCRSQHDPSADPSWRTVAPRTVDVRIAEHYQPIPDIRRYEGNCAVVFEDVLVENRDGEDEFDFGFATN